MSSTIVKNSFALEPLKNGSSTLTIQFFKKGKEDPLSKETFTFFPHARVDSKEHKAKDIASSGYELIDIYSQNGSCSEDIVHTLFKSCDKRGAKEAAKALKNSTLTGHTIFCLDLSDPETLYSENREKTVEKCEGAILQFFQEKLPKKASTAQKVIHSLNPDFVFFEGRLKKKLLESFTAEERTYLNQAKQEFCQITEFFMNALKLGELVINAKGEALSAKDFIAPVKDLSPFEPCETSTVLYPKNYAKLYSIDKPVPQTLMKVYTVWEKCKTAKVITLSVRRPS
jgi:hypothetical protein